MQKQICNADASFEEFWMTHWSASRPGFINRARCKHNRHGVSLIPVVPILGRAMAQTIKTVGCHETTTLQIIKSRRRLLRCSTFARPFRRRRVAGRFSERNVLEAQNRCLLPEFALDSVLPVRSAFVGVCPGDIYNDENVLPGFLLPPNRP